MLEEPSIGQELGPLSPLRTLQQGPSTPALLQVGSAWLRCLNNLQKTEKGRKSEEGRREEKVNVFRVKLTKLLCFYVSKPLFFFFWSKKFISSKKPLNL